MYWQSDEDEEKQSHPAGEMVDLAFAIRCKVLPVDHAWALYLAIQHELPWFEDDKRAGIHPIHTAESAHGWSRPESPDDRLYLPRRTRLILRVPINRIDEARQLEGKSLPVSDCRIQVEKAETRPLGPSNSLVSKGVAMPATEDETSFIQRVLEELHTMGITAKRMLPGRIKRLATPQGEITCCRLGVEGLKANESLILQEQGLGAYRHLGCGIFIPQKEMLRV